MLLLEEEGQTLLSMKSLSSLVSGQNQKSPATCLLCSPVLGLLPSLVCRMEGVADSSMDLRPRRSAFGYRVGHFLEAGDFKRGCEAGLQLVLLSFGKLCEEAVHSVKCLSSLPGYGTCPLSVLLHLYLSCQ